MRGKRTAGGGGLEGLGGVVNEGADAELTRAPLQDRCPEPSVLELTDAQVPEPLLSR